MDNELILFDRLNVIRDTNAKYDLEHNAYISFSGGKDSTVLHHLIDMALPNNKIPRVFSNTGIEYLSIVNFVKKIAENDNRFVMIKPSVKVKATLEKDGYPFKSKRFGYIYALFVKYKEYIWEIMDQLKENENLKTDFDFLDSIEKGKVVVMYLIGKRFNKEKRIVEDAISDATCPKKLMYLFERGNTMNISDKCCLRMKEEPLTKYGKENGKSIYITGIRKSEGGRRQHAHCIQKVGNSVTFHPLAVVSEEWEQWFIDKYNIQLCELYYPPYNFERTGCKGCPFAIKLEETLKTMEKFFPAERKQAEFLWKPVYDEYRRIGYRLRKEDEQMNIFDFL